VQGRKGRPPLTPGKTAGTPRRQNSRTTPAKGKRTRSIRDSDSELSDSDSYIPRSRKRRAAVAAISRMKVC